MTTAAWVVLAGALAVPVPAAGADELWRGAVPREQCRITLVDELGDVRVGASPDPGEAVVRGDAADWTLRAAASSGETSLTVELQVDAGDRPHKGGVEILVPSHCQLAVRTTAGSVRAELGHGASPLDVSTVTGDVTVLVEPGADLSIGLATSGEITVDYSLTIEYRYHEEPAKHGRMQIGGGTTQVRLTSRQGSVSVLRAP